VSHFLLY
jgi:hypothetical protein